MSFEESGLPWILTSPNMPSLDTVRIYPGTCILEGTTLSEGRGTTRPFNIVGAPFLTWHFAAALRSQNTPATSGHLYRETYFIPTFSKFVGNVSAGVDIVIKDPETFNPLRIGLEVLSHARRMTGFEWLQTQGIYRADVLIGSNITRLMIDEGKDVDEILARYQADLTESGFLLLRKKYLIPAYTSITKPGKENDEI